MIGGDGPNVLEIVWGALWAVFWQLLGMFGISQGNIATVAVWVGIVVGGWFLVMWWANRGGREPGRILYVTGPLGAGKSAYAVRLIYRSLCMARPVITNIRLNEDWPRIVSGSSYLMRLRPGRRRRFEEGLRRFYVYEPDIGKLIQAWAACLKCGGDPRTCGHRQVEGRALMVIDEVDNEINNREYQKERQKAFNVRLRMARKRGFVVYLISQHFDNTDRAARRIALEQIRMVNWQQYVRVPFVGWSFLPFPFFLALRYRNNESNPASIRREKPTGRELFVLGRWKKLYNTHQDYGDPGFLEGTEHADTGEAYLLPAPAGGVGARGAPDAAAVGVPRVPGGDAAVLESEGGA